VFKPKVLTCYSTNDIKVSNIPNGPTTIILNGSPYYAYQIQQEGELDIYKFGVIFKSSLGCVSLSEIRW
jgi:hypothetical protein